MANEKARQIFIDALGDHTSGETLITDQQRAEIDAIITMLKRADYLVDDPVMAPHLTMFAFIWARLPRTPELRTDAVVIEQLDAAVARLLNAIGKQPAPTSMPVHAIASDELAQKVAERLNLNGKTLAELVAARITIPTVDSKMIADQLVDKAASGDPAKIAEHLKAAPLFDTRQLYEVLTSRLSKHFLVTACLALLVSFFLGVYLEPVFQHINTFLSGSGPTPELSQLDSQRGAAVQKVQ